MDIVVQFEEKPFDRGRFRYAYRGIYIRGPPNKIGQLIVAKTMIAKDMWSPNDWEESVKIQKVAQDLAKRFVDYCKQLQFLLLGGSAYEVRFTEVSVVPVIKALPGSNLLGQHVIVEDYLPGQYKKWVSNYGYISPESEVLPAFAHWSWVHTRGERMIVDLQGVRRDDLNEYTLTDPVLLSASVAGGELGCGDTGIECMAMFFYHHKCGVLCQHLPRPTNQNVEAIIPELKGKIDIVMAFLKLLQDQTSYAHEQKLPTEIKIKLVDAFKQIALGNNHPSCVIS